MNTRYPFPMNSFCGSSPAASPAGEERGTVSLRNRSARTPTSSLLVRTAMRISRARWFTFLRRVFHYQNGSRSNLGSNPFNSSTWMMLEFVALVIQISITMFTLAISKAEKPVWPVRIWIIGYNIGCVLSLLLLYGRYRQINTTQGDGFGLPDLEQQRGSEESSVCRCSILMHKCRTSLELFFAIWFVMGNVWVFDSRFGSYHRAPKLHVLCISLLAWNALSYSFPFLLFLLLCCCVPLISTVLGYNMNMGSAERGASDDQISSLPSWRYKAADTNSEFRNNADCNSTIASEDLECCICLAKYKDKEEVRKLPCSHMFHLKCVDQWLRIISCCPLFFLNVASNRKKKNDHSSSPSHSCPNHQVLAINNMAIRMKIVNESNMLSFNVYHSLIPLSGKVRWTAKPPNKMDTQEHLMEPSGESPEKTYPT
ncbi:E3 ubiquitin-protein ligase [Populus alba x Populus x berolinensis]|uniref:E3 ubiquitin-protein ligase n=1 Tax=Populus alba x Populus x berolinensis TaxID=444605 RepID=A0AAD6RSL8_9ROSI|nr:E3 ubiquitin-protein ligase [Populus alba x Populus x berolinensis]